MPDFNTQTPKSKEERRISFGKKAAAAAVVGVAALAATVTGLRNANEAPETSPAEVAMLRVEQPSVRTGILTVKAGANVRTTPERSTAVGGPNAPESTDAGKNISDITIEEGQNLVVVDPFTDESGRWLGFSVPSDEPQADSSAEAQAAKTYWIDYDALQDQGLASFSAEDTWLDPVIDEQAVGSFVPNDGLADYISSLQTGTK